MLSSFGILLSLLASVVHTLPYNPTNILLSSDSSAIYLFASSEDGSNFQLSAFNLSSTISTSKTGASIIASSLPFAPQSTTALTVSIDAADKIYLVAGECTDGANGARLYSIAPSDPDPQWKEIQLNTIGVEKPSANGGINALSGSMRFNDDTYIFGGLCPNSTSLTVDNWQESGTYSNALLSMSSNGTLTQVVTRGPPVAEAGFSVTPLDAAYLNNSNFVAIQQSFVLVGGQTQSAFINMSQVALFSLPQESWSFASVDVSHLSTSFDPRSGHAAALSDDGKTIFVSGGWVGDVNTAAEPQFLTLSVGSTYGGSGDWSWSIPDQSGAAPSLYGHSMVTLPGDILMIAGGYSLPAPSSKIRRRDGTLNTAAYFFNTSSNTWISEYTSPYAQSSPTQKSSSSNGLKIGLGVGLGLGLGLLLILGLCLWFGRRKIREHRRERDRRLLQQSMNAANGPQPYETEPGQWMMERNRTGANPYPWAPVQGDPESVRRASQAERTGLSYDIPSPTRGLRRSLHSRPGSHKFEDGGRSRATGQIHTIAESDENEKPQDMMEQDVVAAAPVLDPFQDSSHLLDRSPSPTSPSHERELEMQHWHNDWAQAERRRQSGRISPNKSDGTSSSLSDSNGSIVSALSYQTSIRRDGSRKSVPQVSPPDSPVGVTHRRKRSKSFGIGHRTTDSFPQLQAEGQNLLGGPAAAGEPSSKRSSASTGILGSVRRALGSNRSSLNTPERSATTASMSQGTIRGNTTPQRSASLGAMTYSRRLQGAQDWGENSSPPKSLAEDAVGEDDWDVESAVERRVVQVMFTVPRGSLRVVNAGPESDAVSTIEGDAGAEAETEMPLLASVAEHAKGKGKALIQDNEEQGR